MYSNRLKIVIAANYIFMISFAVFTIAVNEDLLDLDILFIPILIIFLLIWVLLIIIPFYIKYEMWDGIWKTPQWQTIMFIVLAVGLITGIIMEEGTKYCSSLIIVLINANNLVDNTRSYKMAVKYDMDHLKSVQELISLHPETEELINDKKKSL